MSFFLYEDDSEEPFFRRWLTVPFQTRPLKIKSEDIRMDLEQFLNKYSEVRMLINDNL